MPPKTYPFLFLSTLFFLFPLLTLVFALILPKPYVTRLCLLRSNASIKLAPFWVNNGKLPPRNNFLSLQ